MTKPPLKNQPSAAPTRKVAAGGIGTSLGMIIGWAVVSLLAKSGVDIPAEIEGEIYALATGLSGLVIGLASAYLTRERSSDGIQ